jgi:hypothetical protein
MRACLTCLILVGFTSFGCSQEGETPDSGTPAGQNTNTEADLPKADLAESAISADRSPVEIVRGASLTAAAGGQIVVEGSLRIDPDANIKPHAIIKIIGTAPDGGAVNASTKGAEVEPVEGRENVHRFRAVLKVPKRKGNYRIVGNFLGKPFAERTLTVK